MTLTTQQSKEIKGYYGYPGKEATIFYCKGWYCVEGSKNVNYTEEEVEEGTNIEELYDLDTMTTKPINSLNELIKEVEELEEEF